MGTRMLRWISGLVPVLIGLGLSGVLSFLLDLGDLFGGSVGRLGLASVLGGAVLTALLFAFYRVQVFPRPSILGAALWIVFCAYPAFGLLIAGVAYAIVGPEIPWSSEATLIVILSGLYGPVLGLPALLGAVCVGPRPWAVRILGVVRIRAEPMVNLTIVGAIGILIWTAAEIRVRSLAPSAGERAQHAAQEEQRWAALEKATRTTSDLAREFLTKGHEAAGRIQEDSPEAILPEQLIQCLSGDESVVECGLLERDGKYRAARKTAHRHCGLCNVTSCEPLPPPDDARAALFSIPQLGSHPAIAVAAQDVATWAEPTLHGGIGCEEISYVVPKGGAHFVVTLSLAPLSKVLKSLALSDRAQPPREAFITDFRGYVVASSTGDRYLHHGASVGLCMTLVDCGGRAPATRGAAKEALAEGSSRFTLRAERYARWLGASRAVAVTQGAPDPEWLLAAVVLGPDM